ncbi:MAG: hypothetical protein LBR17_01435 [Bacteroidales bacterium]|jgi:hypothetical protein|nr:hypothetical protein [Bacteroidales bacterium]
MSKNNKTEKKNTVKFSFSLSKADYKQLLRYCIINKLGEKVAIKKILRTYLSENLPKPDEDVENQLELFKPFQRNIFDRG